MRLYDAYRRGIITSEQYIALLEEGLTPDSSYSSAVPVPTTPGTNYATGYTTSTYVAVLDVNTAGSHQQNVTIRNFGSYSLDFSVEYYNNDILYETKDGTLVASDVFLSLTSDPCVSIIVKVKSTTATPTSYEAGLAVN